MIFAAIVISDQTSLHGQSALSTINFYTLSRSQKFTEIMAPVSLCRVRYQSTTRTKYGHYVGSSHR